MTQTEKLLSYLGIAVFLLLAALGWNWWRVRRADGTVTIPGELLIPITLVWPIALVMGLFAVVGTFAAVYTDWLERESKRRRERLEAAAKLLDHLERTGKLPEMLEDNGDPIRKELIQRLHAGE